MIYQNIIPIEQININTKELYRILGYPPNEVPQNIVNDVHVFYPKALKKMKIEIGCKAFSSGEVQIDMDFFSIQGIRFNCGKIVGKYLQKCQILYLFAVTLGNDFDDYYNSFFHKGDPYSGYLINTIGSAVVETAADYLSEIIQNDLITDDFKITNRFSPGYCQWNVNEQHNLFSLLPEGFLNIKLNDSALMKPIKSVSGVIGGGINAEKKDYTCSLCTLKNCIMRKNHQKEK